MRFRFDERKSVRLRANPKRGVGFEEAQEVLSHPHYLDDRSDLPEQYRAIGWVGEQLYTVIFEVREDEEGECYHLVTLWKATKQEAQLYGEHSETSETSFGRGHRPPCGRREGCVTVLHQ
jgi:uncharacterized DUF497 family protein